MLETKINIDLLVQFSIQYLISVSHIFLINIAQNIIFDNKYDPTISIEKVTYPCGP